MAYPKAEGTSFSDRDDEARQRRPLPVRGIGPPGARWNSLRRPTSSPDSGAECNLLAGEQKVRCETVRPNVSSRVSDQTVVEGFDVLELDDVARLDGEAHRQRLRRIV